MEEAETNQVALKRFGPIWKGLFTPMRCLEVVQDAPDI